MLGCTPRTGLHINIWIVISILRLHVFASRGSKISANDAASMALT